MTFVAGFGIPAVAASATGWISQYGPIAWVIAGFLGWVLFVMLAYATTVIRRKWFGTSLLRRFYEPGDKINPVTKVFEDKRIYFSDLVPPRGFKVTGKTFVGCELVGPIVMTALQGTAIETCAYADCDHVLIRKGTGSPNDVVRNAYVFEDCKFFRCVFYAVTFLVIEPLYHLTETGGGCNWITYTPANPPEWSAEKPASQEK